MEFQQNEVFSNIFSNSHLAKRVQKSSENSSVPNKSRKKIEEKINLNIFLGHNVPDLGSDSECGVRHTNGKSVFIFFSLEINC